MLTGKEVYSFMYWYSFLAIKSRILKVEAVKFEMIVAGSLRKSNFLIISTYSIFETYVQSE